MPIYNNPAIGAGFSAIAEMFRPPSVQEYAAAETAKAKRAETARLEAVAKREAEAWNQSQDPNFDQSRFDRTNVALGNYAPNAGYDLTTRGQDIDASTALSVAKLGDIAKLYGPLDPGQVRPAVPEPIASLYGAPAIAAEQGRAKPLSETEWQAGQSERLRSTGQITDEQILAATMGSTPTMTVKGANGRPRVAYSATAAASGAEPAVGGRPMTPAERKSYGVPDTLGGFMDAEGTPHTLSGSGTSVNVNSTGEGKFEQTVGESQGKMFAGMAEDAVNAKSDRALLGQLRGRIEELPGGFVGGAQAIANSYGIKLGENASALEAADAIISRLVPGARQGMPGATSDRDVAMFRSSLPKLANTREGNRLILNTLDAMAGYRESQGSIATAVTTGQMTRSQGLAALQGLPNPLAAFTAAEPPPSLDGASRTPQRQPQADLATPQSDADFAALPSGATYRDPDDGRTYRKQ